MNSIIQPVAASSIHWLSGDSKPLELACPVCREIRHNAPLLEVPSMADRSKLTLFTCSACGSKFFDPPGICDFSEVLGKGKYFWKGYVEVVGGIWEMYWPAACSSPKSAANLLDIGCGFGFTVDAWRRLRGEAIGVELADYGRAGAEQLDVPIYFDYLQNISELQTKRFDVVYASEVIEHVPDPREFAALLSRYVADDGVLCLTTPGAEFIQEKNASSTLAAALSPGFHGFLISSDELEKILRASGFAHVLVRQFGERLIGWASQRPLNIDENLPLLRAEYLRYLEEILVSRKENDFVTDGIAYRHFRDTVLAGQFDAARISLSRLEISLKEKYQTDLLAPRQTLEHVLTLTVAEDYNAAYPWFLPNFYFARGMYAKLFERDEQSAREFFRASRHLATYIAASWGSHHVLEALSFLPEAWQQEAVSAAINGDPSVCEEWLAVVANGGYISLPELGGNRLSNRQIEQAYLEGLSIFTALNRPEALRKALHDCLQHMERVYGDWLRTDSTAPENVPGGTLQHEQRMYLHFKIAASCIQFGAHPELIRPLLERVLQLGKIDKPSAMAKWIASEAGAKLAALSPPSPKSWSGRNTGAAHNLSYSSGFISKTKF